MLQYEIKIGSSDIESSGLVIERRSQFLGGFLACLFARLFVFALLFRAVVCLAVLAIEEPLGILVESRLDLAQLCLRSLKVFYCPRNINSLCQMMWTLT